MASRKRAVRSRWTPLMSKQAKQVTVIVDPKTGKPMKLAEKAPKGQRRMGVDQYGRALIYDDKGNIVAMQG